jgi:polyisoprenoid-binding protein YceI
MRRISSGISIVAFIALSAPFAAAEDYTLDAAHTGVSFQVSHIGLSLTHGRFNDVSGTFTIAAANPAASSFALSIKSASIDTGNAKRDEHLRSPDFLNSKQYPAISFKSTSVKGVGEGLSVTGDLTLHGETKPVTFVLKGGKTAEFPKGVKRTGYSTELTIKRSEFGMDKMLDAIGDEIRIAISFEGTQK